MIKKIAVVVLLVLAILAILPAVKADGGPCPADGTTLSLVNTQVFSNPWNEFRLSAVANGQFVVYKSVSSSDGSFALLDYPGNYWVDCTSITAPAMVATATPVLGGAPLVTTPIPANAGVALIGEWGFNGGFSVNVGQTLSFMTVVRGPNPYTVAAGDVVLFRCTSNGRTQAVFQIVVVPATFTPAGNFVGCSAGIYDGTVPNLFGIVQAEARNAYTGATELP